MYEQLITAAPYILLSIFIFALFRELICWYFKINKRAHLQEQILAELVKARKKEPVVNSNKGYENDKN